MKQKMKSFLNTFAVVALVAAIIVSVSGIMLLGEVVAGWDGTATSTFASGKGTEASPYLISTQKQLGYFMNQLNAGVTYEGLYIKLNTDLDMTGGKWTVAESTLFSGTFLGNNKTLTMDSNFLGTIAETGKVDWLNLKGSGTLESPLMCYTNNGTIQNCRVSGNVSMSDTINAGLLCLTNSKTGLVVNSCGIGSVYGKATDKSCYVGWISKSEGTIKNCYTVIELSGEASGDYNKLHTGLITATGSSENCYSNTNVIKNDAATVASLNGTVGVSGYIWAVDSNNVNDGYPIIKTCLTALTQLSNSAESVIVIHSTTWSAALSASESGCIIYYTLDGTDPATSTTRKTYSSPFSISKDTIITSVAYKNGSYGIPNRQQVVQLLGSGTTESPYIISTNVQLYVVRLEPDKVYQLTRDLDFTNEPKIYQNENWVSIPSFSGELHGNGHSITGLSSITGGLVDSNNGLIKELRLIDHQLCVSSDDYHPDSFGAIANSNSGTITRCFAGTNPDIIRYTSVTDNSVGGIVGYNRGTISYCSSSGTIKLESNDYYPWYDLGGIAGYNFGTIQSCYSDMSLYGAPTRHDLGAYISGISFGGIVYDSRFDGYCEVSSATASFGVGAGAEHGGRASSYRIYDGGATFTTTSGSSRKYYTVETDLYGYMGDMETSYPAFDFDSVWMMTADGPMPQGIMTADGRCMAKYSYTEPTCTASGSAVSYDMLNTSYRKTDTLPMVDHTYGTTPTWNWTGDQESGYTAAEAMFTCACGHEETVTAALSGDTTNPTTEAEGQTVYTAEVSFMDTAYTDIRTVSIPRVEITPVGYTVSGSAVSWNASDDAIFLLYSGGLGDASIHSEWMNGSEFTALYTAIKGEIIDIYVDDKAMKSQSFTFEGVEEGTYKLVILKPGKYVPKIVQVSVAAEAVDAGQRKLWMYGDVNYDGSVDTNDALQMNRYNNTKGSVITIGTADEIAEKIKVCDINCDGVLDTNDVVQVNRYINTKGSLFNNFK